MRPALPIEIFSWSRLPTWPIVARHSACTIRCSPEGSLSSANLPSLAINCACTSRAARELRARAGLHLDRVHDGAERDVLERQRVARLDIGLRARLDLGADFEAVGREDVASSRRRHNAAARYSPSDSDRIRAPRRRPESPSWLRLKSIRRRRRLCPPPRWREVMRPRLLRPPDALERRQQTLLGLLLGELREIRNLHEALAGRARIKLNYCHRYPLIASI